MERDFDLIAPENPKRQTSDTISCSTMSCNTAFLAKAWADRAKLNDVERSGFAQYFYSTICSHLESELTLHFEQRISDCKMFAENGAVLFKKANSPEEKQNAKARVAAIRFSLASILANVSSEVERAPLKRLCQLYGEVFGRTFDVVVGGEVAQDIRALGSIRNLFAHGRDFFFEFDGVTPSGETPKNLTLDSHSLEDAARRLREAGILPAVPFDRSTHDRIRNAFYGDAALLYFYRAVRQAEEAVRKDTGSPIALIFALAQSLPDLG